MGRTLPSREYITSRRRSNSAVERIDFTCKDSAKPKSKPPAPHHNIEYSSGIRWRIPLYLVPIEEISGNFFYSTVFGYQAGRAITTGDLNTAFGYRYNSGPNISEENNNIFIGAQAGYAITTRGPCEGVGTASIPIPTDTSWIKKQ